MPRVLYVQYAMPGAYPPVMHSAAILARGGWRVRMLGRPISVVERLTMDETSGLELRLLGGPTEGPLLKLHYLLFILWSLWHALVWRADWLYVSDAMAAPVGVLARALLRRTGIVYHEHDEPAGSASSPVMRVVHAARRSLVRLADAVVVPNAARGERLRAAAGTSRPVHVVWNCPTLDEMHSPEPLVEGRLRVVYHGSVNEARLPRTVLEAVAGEPGSELVIIGYETVGSTGYLDLLREDAKRLGIAERVTFAGTMPRRDVLDECARGDLGIVFMSRGVGDDENQMTMVGASNKAFDYLACGLTFLAVDLPEWRAAFVEPGFALAVDPASAESVGRALAWCRAHPVEARAMGARGRARVLEDWNYEAQFAPVRALLEGRDT